MGRTIDTGERLEVKRKKKKPRKTEGRKSANDGVERGVEI